MLDMGLQNYVDWHVKPVMRIRDGYGYRVVLKYLDGTEKTQQRAGFHTKREANAARDKTIAELLYHDSAKMQAPIFPGEEVSSP